MSTALEDRLIAALHARAELVQPESLTHHAPGTPAPRRPWRRPALAVLAAAACIAVGVALATRGGNEADQRPLPPTSSSLPSGRFTLPEPRLTDRLTGDVDGDGRPDRIRTDGNTISVTLAADPSHPLTFTQEALQGLVGLADVGGGAQAIVESDTAVSGGSEWLVLGIRGGKLTILLAHHGPVRPGVRPGAGNLGIEPGRLFSWFDSHGVLMSGVLDPMQNGARRLAVYASRVEPQSDRLKVTRLGPWCWDVATQRTPAPCPPGVDYSFAAGRHGFLPRLLPMNGPAEGAISPPPSGPWQQGTTSLRLVEGPVHAASESEQVYDVVGTIDGHHVSARAGVFNPMLLTRYLDLGHGVRGLAVDDESVPRWNILAFVDGRLVPASVTGDLRPGHERYQTWVGPDGQAFTRVPHGSEGHYEVYEWQVTDGSGRTLKAVDLGQVCMDDSQGTYGLCPSSR